MRDAAPHSLAAAILAGSGTSGQIRWLHTDPGLARRFDELQRDALDHLTAGSPSIDILRDYASRIGTQRLALFDSEVDAISTAGSAIITPSTHDTEPRGLLAAIAARVPVVACAPRGGHGSLGLFEAGRDIRFYNPADPESLLGHLRELHSAPLSARAQADAAHDLVRHQHTAETRASQVLQWIETGTSPAELGVSPSAGDASVNAPQRPVMLRPERTVQGQLPDDSNAGQPSPGDAWELAADLAERLGCGCLIDIGTPAPWELVRVSPRLKTIAVDLGGAAGHIAKRVAGVQWLSQDDDWLDRHPELQDASCMVLCAFQLEHRCEPLAFLERLGRIVNGPSALVIIRDRWRWWGPPMPHSPSKRAPFGMTAGEARGLFDQSGLAVVFDSRFPGSRDSRQLDDHLFLMLPKTATEERRSRWSEAAAHLVGALLEERATASPFQLLTRTIERPIVWLDGTTGDRAGARSLSALMPDDTFLSVHSTRAPLQEASRWADRLGPLAGRPLVVFGLGLGYHATAAAARPDAGRVIVVEPFADVVSHARRVPETARSLDSRRIELVDSWRAFKEMAQATDLNTGETRLEVLPVYQRLADHDVSTFSTLFAAARAWASEGIDAACGPFFRPPGMSVVVSTYNRVDGAVRILRRLAAQEPCGVPTEILLVNDHGDAAVFDAARTAVADAQCELRCFDTRYEGYGLTLARNTGIRFARYDTVVFLDDDLEIGPDLLRQYAASPEGVRMGRIDSRYEDRGRINHLDDRRIAMQGPVRVLRPWAAFEGFMWGGNCAVPTELALALGGFDVAFLGEGEEDLDFSTRAVRATHRPVAVTSALAVHEGLDRSTAVWLGFERFRRPGKANELLADPTRGLVVNGGVSYWAGERWERHVVR